MIKKTKWNIVLLNISIFILVFSATVQATPTIAAASKSCLVGREIANQCHKSIPEVRHRPQLDVGVDNLPDTDDVILSGAFASIDSLLASLREALYAYYMDTSMNGETPAYPEDLDNASCGTPKTNNAFFTELSDYLSWAPLTTNTVGDVKFYKLSNGNYLLVDELELGEDLLTFCREISYSDSSIVEIE